MISIFFTFVLYIGFFIAMEFAGLTLTQAWIAAIFLILAHFFGYMEGMDR